MEASAKADVLKKMNEEIGWGPGDALYFRETEMLVRGIFHGADKGYGQDNLWRFMVTVKNVEEIGATKKVKIPGLWPVD